MAQGGGEGGWGVEEREQGLERSSRGIHVLGLAPIGRAIRGWWKGCTAGNSWSEGIKGRGEAGSEETTPKGEGGDAKYNEYSEPGHKSTLT